jgi:hypothetical protein
VGVERFANKPGKYGTLTADLRYSLGRNRRMGKYPIDVPDEAPVEVGSYSSAIAAFCGPSNLVDAPATGRR